MSGQISMSPGATAAIRTSPACWPTPRRVVVIVPAELLYMRNVVGNAEVDEGLPGITGNAEPPLALASSAASEDDG